MDPTGTTSMELDMAHFGVDPSRVLEQSKGPKVRGRLEYLAIEVEETDSLSG